MDKLETCNLTELVIDTQNGVDGAFERLYKETIKFSYRVACVLLKNENDIEDALQNSYMYVARYIKDLRDPKSFESWLSTIIRNECRKHIAREKKASDIFASVISSKEFELLSEESIPFDLMEKSEIVESVRLIVEKLPDEKRACIMLYYFEQNTLPEIAEILGIPEGTVKSRLYNGRKILEKELKKLQKKDETFYGISVIPLITAFFAYQMKNIVVPASIAEGASICIAAAEGAASATAVSAAAATGTSAAGAGTAGAGATGAGTAATGTAAAAGTSAVTSVAGTAGAAVATKVAAVAVAAAVATGGGVATVNYVADKREAQLTTVPQTSVTEEYTTAPAFAEKTTLVFLETTSLLTTVFTTKKAETTAGKTTSSVSQTTEDSTVIAVKTTRKRTTVPATTVTSTTAVVTTREETTTAKATTTKITTTQPTTQKETSTAAPTTDASEIYNVSGGILSDYTGGGGSVAVPSTVGGENVTAIGTAAFAGNSSITSVSIPSTVTKIGQEAFADCTGLKSVSLPSSLQSIGIGSFCGCTSLTSVDIPSGVTTIGDDAFADCSSLSTVTIPSSVTSIGENAFGGCNNLTIRCSEGSAAHNYAVENSINYELI
ncbi:MAG: sigma-70 family RNA polymerase sigma factor [Acutalibacteraceae bacterium]